MASYQQGQQQQQAPEFGTVLAAREKSEPPTELEIALRHCCQRLKVVSKLTGGAHFLLKVSDASVALRVYGAKETIEIEKKWQEGGVSPEQWTRQCVPQRPTEGSNGTESGDGSKDHDFVSGLQTFRDSFMHTAVFFVLPAGETQTDQLVRSDSFLGVAQRALVSAKKTVPQDSQPGQKQKPTGSSRVFIVPDTRSLRVILKSVVESIKPEKRALKEKFFAAQRKANLLPDSATGLPVSQDAIASRVADAFRSWAGSSGLPSGEADVIMSVLGSLKNIASADKAALDNVPISEKTKITILDFFATAPSLMDASGPTDIADGGAQYAEDPNENEYGADSQTTEQQYQETLHHPIDSYSLPNPDTTSRQQTAEHLQQYPSVPDATPRLTGPPGPGLVSDISGNVVDFTPMHLQSSTAHANSIFTSKFGASEMSRATYRQRSSYGSSHGQGRTSRSPGPSYGRHLPYGSSQTHGGRSPYQQSAPSPAGAYSNAAQFGREGQGYSSSGFQAYAYNNEQSAPRDARGLTGRASSVQGGTTFASSAYYRNHGGRYYR